MKIIDNVRPDRQTVMFSATFPRQMEALARRILSKPIEVQVGGRSVVCKDVEQYVVSIIIIINKYSLFEYVDSLCHFYSCSLIISCLYIPYFNCLANIVSLQYFFLTFQTQSLRCTFIHHLTDMFLFLFEVPTWKQVFLFRLIISRLFWKMARSSWSYLSCLAFTRSRAAFWSSSTNRNMPMNWWRTWWDIPTLACHCMVE